MNFLEKSEIGVINKMRPFAEKVRDAREKCGFSQTELAEKIGISKRSVIAYESGEKEPRHSTLMKLAKALGVSKIGRAHV